MKRLWRAMTVIVAFVLISTFGSCKQAPEPDPEPLASIGELGADFVFLPPPAVERPAQTANAGHSTNMLIDIATQEPVCKVETYAAFEELPEMPGKYQSGT